MRDYLKTAEHLERVTRTDNEFTQRALPFRLVVSAGQAKGYMDLADLFDSGIRANKGDSAGLFKARAEYRKLAEKAANDFADAYLKFEKSGQNPNITLEFGYPATNMTEPTEVAKIKGGAVLGDDIMPYVQRRMVELAMVRTTCQMVGAPDDPAKAQALLQKGSAQIPRDVFFLGLANQLYGLAILFDRLNLNDPNRLTFFGEKGLEALKSVKESDETKELADYLQSALKVGKR